MSKKPILTVISMAFILVVISLGVIGGCNNHNNGDGTFGEEVPDRVITFINNCKETIWIGSQNLDNSTTSWELMGSSEGCMSDMECRQGLTKTANCKNRKCQQVVSVSGTCTSCQAWARTGCDFKSDGLCNNTDSKFNCCATAGCTIQGGQWGFQCDSGAQAPVTLVEFTFQTPPKNDFYDVSLIGGMNVPAEIKPAGSTAPLPEDNASDYWCGNPGGAGQSTPDLDCTDSSWSLLTDGDNKCNSFPELRVVNPTVVSQDFNCGSESTNMFIAGVGNVCTCTDSNDGQCNNGEICGVGNNQIIGTQVCGQFAGCTTPKALCGIYLEMTNHPNLGDELVSCDTILSGAPSCNKNSDCPQLVGIEFNDENTCMANCPNETKCFQTGKNAKTGQKIYGCQMKCDKEKKVCQNVECTSDSDCLMLKDGTMSSTFMLCDTETNKCSSTIASLYETNGINGQSCYTPSDKFMGNKFNAATTFCSGCPTECENPPCTPWPIPSGSNCATTADGAGSSCGTEPCTNIDWEEHARPMISAFKEACPAAYSFPFDDPTSTFQCRGTDTPDTLGYDITFCPGDSSL